MPDSDSPPNDVNVTTSCSCVMALALAGKFDELYSDDPRPEPPDTGTTLLKLLQELVRAPWMSSGLPENNAFTTTLVLRTFGFLLEAGMLTATDADSISKAWEPHLRFSDVGAFVKRLISDEPLSKLLFSLFSGKSKLAVRRYDTDGANEESIKRLLSTELERIIGTAVLYEESRFAGVSLSEEAQALIAADLDGYSTARLNRILVHDYYAGQVLDLKSLSLKEIATEMSSDASRFKINNYPPASAVIYWFIDGVARANISLRPPHWTHLCQWAGSQFNRERSLVLADHDAMMDPVAMAMAACVCARMRHLGTSATTDHPDLGPSNQDLELLPSQTELEHSILELFKRQTHGIWPKYFPLFHYQDAGSNFCFTFELLEAVLCEFGRSENELINDARFVDGLEKAVTWCEKNYLESPAKNHTYTGWNSGGYLESLKKGQPESWATAVVHMFLWELAEVLSAQIQRQLLVRYEARKLDSGEATIESLLDIEILEKGVPEPLNDILLSEFVTVYRGQDERSLRKRPIKRSSRSALLFGPPGTSKTKVTEAIAGDLGWMLIQIDPSHFLKEGLDGIYLQADRIFKDLMDLSGVVILFDEMDALVQTRDSDLKLDTAAQFLTTYMLPKLTALHDRGRLLFFMATNFQERFDKAIKRTGRFDLLLCMGPPTLKAKLASIHKFLGLKEATKESREVADAIREHLTDYPRIEVQLELYTYGEFLSLINALPDRESGILDAVKEMTNSKFEDWVKKDSQYVGLRIGDLNAKWGKKWKTLADLDEKKIARKKIKEDEITPIDRYLFDRRESKRQG